MARANFFFVKSSFFYLCGNGGCVGRRLQLLPALHSDDGGLLHLVHVDYVLERKNQQKWSQEFQKHHKYELRNE